MSGCCLDAPAVRAAPSISIGWIGQTRVANLPTMNLWSGARDLYFALRDYGDTRAHDELVVPWLVAGREAYSAQLEPLATYGRVPGNADEETQYWLAIPYALSRVSDVLLLGFQPKPDPEMAVPWAHKLHLADNTWPAIAVDEYLELFTALGMTEVTDSGFDPFCHEIAEVEQDEDPDAPITITDRLWPGLMLGQMLFSRAGVRVRAGVNHAQRGIADRAPLYSTFLRRYRPTVDASLGWGHNSQWDTDFRRDYRTDQAVHLSIDATGDIDAYDPDDDEPILTGAQRRDLLRHRCLLRLPEAVGTLADNLWPYSWPLTIPTGQHQ